MCFLNYLFSFQFTCHAITMAKIREGWEVGKILWSEGSTKELVDHLKTPLRKSWFHSTKALLKESWPPRKFWLSPSPQSTKSQTALTSVHFAPEHLIWLKWWWSVSRSPKQPAVSTCFGNVVFFVFIAMCLCNFGNNFIKFSHTL